MTFSLQKHSRVHPYQ
ncbi:TPA: hypothetical protein MHT97_00950 [Klebsiella pneumoniae]|nr:hypothetical protein [Klebsiella pneumoniae]HBX2594246.1 hypothetical protein [Klebsiella pneumoniae]HBY1629887.1 hypothetical protein [Klebsiella pneumoniae]HBZ1524496.1 hypothetical protein [Klebsiella pneumoniae]